MGKTLILFRHAKSDWDAAAANDHQRPLAQRGIKAAKAMGRMLAEVDQLPDLAVASTALRATATLELAAAAGDWPTRIKTDAALYETTPEAALDFIQNLPTTADSVMLVGHEPTWSALTSALTAGGNLRFPTAAMVRIDFELQRWAEIRFGLGSLVWFIPPRFVTDGKRKH
jgi:phosphohistidine phosphatase